MKFDMSKRFELAEVLTEIVRQDTNYDARYILVLRAMGLAAQSGIATGIRIDPEDPAWPVVFIELPTGQVSWHLPSHSTGWDGHLTVEKFSRIKAFAEYMAIRRMP